MICLLYRDFLVLASAAKMTQIYTIHACIALAELKIEEVDNGRGMLLVPRRASITILRGGDRFPN
jgi:hypothetical protein